MVCVHTVGLMRHHQVIKRNIKAAALDQEVALVEIARAIGMEKSKFYRRTSGRQEWRVNELLAVAKVLGVEISQLLSGTDEAEDFQLIRKDSHKPKRLVA